MLAREILPNHGSEAPICIFAPLLSGLSGGKMSASDESSKVNLNDSPEDVVDKIQEAYCPMGEVEGNGVLEYLEYLVFPVLAERGEEFVVERPDEYGGDPSTNPTPTWKTTSSARNSTRRTSSPRRASTSPRLSTPFGNDSIPQPDLLAEAYPEKYGDE